MAKTTQNKKETLFPSWILVGCAAIVILVSWVYNYFSSQQDYFYILHLHSFYADNEPYFEELQRNSAWLLTLVGSYITQFFINPKFPSVVIPLICLIQFLLLEWLFNTRSRKVGYLLVCVLLLPSIFAYLSGQNYDYAIYDRLDSSVYIVLFIGQLISVGLYSLSKISIVKSYVITLMVSLVLSPLIGIFSLVSVLMIVVDSFAEKNRFKGIVSVVFLVCTLLVMLLFGVFCYHEYWYVTLFNPLVNPMFETTFYYALVSIIVLSLLPLLQIFKFREDARVNVIHFLGTLVCSVVMFFVSINYLSYDDSNFYAELKAKRLLDSHDWKNLYSVTSKVKNPTSTIIAYQEIATVIREKMIKDAFNIEPIYHGYNTDHFVTPHFVHYSDLAYYSGLPNVALFYAMETKQLSGMDFGVLKTMQEVAMLNKEYDLARKYQDILASSSVYKDYAERWRGYISNPEKMYKELTYLPMIERLIDFSPSTYSAQSIQEVMMNRQKLDNGLTLIVRLYCDMYQRDMKRFSQDVVASSSYFATRKVPTVIQEACVICDIAGDHLPMQYIRVDNDVFNRTYNIVREINSINNDKLAVSRLKSRYKGTYTYYYMLSTTDESMYKGADKFNKMKK